MTDGLREAGLYWGDEKLLMSTLVNGLVSPSLAEKFKAQILDNKKEFGLEAFDPDGTPQYLGGRFAMHVLRSKEIYVEGWLRGIASDFKFLLCDQCAYCANRNQMDGVNLAAAITDALLASTAAMPVPIACIGVYLVKKQILDRVCGCDSQKQS